MPEENLISEEINTDVPVSVDAEEETSAVAEEQPEGVEDSETSEESDQDQGDDKPRKSKGGFQRRIDRLTQEKRYLESVVERLVGQPAGQPAAEQKPAPQQQQGRPDAKNFSDYDQYVEALGRWGAEQRLAEEDQKRNQYAREEQQRQQVSEWDSKQQAARKELRDYDDVIADADDVPMSPAMRDAIIESEVGPKLAYYLAKNPAEAARIARLHPAAANRELGRLEVKLIAAPKQSAPVSKAPEPIRPVGAKTGGAPKKPLREVNDFAEYERRRRSGEKV